MSNKIVGLLKNNTSWHGVERIHCPENLSRKSFLVSISIPKNQGLIKNIHDWIHNKIVVFLYNIK